MSDLLWLLGIAVAVVGVLFAIVFGLAIALDSAECSGFQKGTGIETQWRWGCYAKVDGKWIPKEYVFGKVNELRVKEK